MDSSNWQPINTAPRDGTEILASDLDCIDIVSWFDGDFEPKSESSGWINREYEDRFPCFWQPLPEHPVLPLPNDGVNNA